MPLSESEQKLWDRIDSFSLDDPASEFCFTLRLARDNRWHLPFAVRVVQEYKKFMFLAVCAGHPVTPSQHVDQAWHLHLVYTRSYWEEFCGDLLEQPVHHGPTRGGSIEQDKFTDWYQRTQQSYREKFDDELPVDIWPPPQIRFDRSRNPLWVSTREFWLVRKPDFSRLVSRDSLSLVAAVLMPLALVAWSPFDLNGPKFLVFYLLLMIGAVVTAFLSTRYLAAGTRGSSRLLENKNPRLTSGQLAYLAGGELRLLQSAVCELLVAKQANTLRQRLQIHTSASNSANVKELSSIARSIHSKLERDRSIDYRDIREAARLPVARIASELSSIELVNTRLKRHALMWLNGLIMSGVLAVGILRIMQAISRGRPFGFLALEMIVAIALTALLIFAVPLRTRRGDELLAEEVTRIDGQLGEKLTRQSNPRTTAGLVGLMGPSILKGTELRSLGKGIELVCTGPISAGTGGGGTGCGVGGGGCGGGGGGCGGCGG